MIIRRQVERLEDSLLLLDMSKLTNEVHELLFSDYTAQKFSSAPAPHSASMGILPHTYWKSILPEYMRTLCSSIAKSLATLRLSWNTQ